MRIHCIGAHSLVAYSSLFLYANSASSCPGQKCYRNPFRILHRFSPLLAHRECPVPNTRARLATGDDANVRCPFEGVYSIASLFIEIKIKGTGDKFLCIIFVYRITKKKKSEGSTESEGGQRPIPNIEVVFLFFCPCALQCVQQHTRSIHLQHTHAHIYTYILR